MKTTGRRLNLYLDARAEEALRRFSVRESIPLSAVVSSLLHALNGDAEEDADKPVFTALKRVFGRESFLRFFSDAAETLPKGFRAVSDATRGAGRVPDFWLCGSTGVYAFFSFSKENVGRLLADVFALKARHKLSTLIVVTLGAGGVDESTRGDLSKVGIKVVQLGQLQRAVAEACAAEGKGRRK